MKGPGQDSLVPGLANSPYVLQGFDNLLHKERVAFSALGNQGLECCREAFGGEQCLRHMHAVRRGERRQRNPCMVGPFSKGMGIPSAVGKETENPSRGETVCEEGQKCLSGLIHPLQILEHYDLWVYLCSTHDHMPHGSKDLTPTLLRVHGLHHRPWINGKKIV
jgi:hypothetical protein